MIHYLDEESFYLAVNAYDNTLKLYFWENCKKKYKYTLKNGNL